MRTFVEPSNKIRKNATKIETAILEKKILKSEIFPHKSLRYFSVSARGRARVRVQKERTSLLAYGERTCSFVISSCRTSVCIASYKQK
jgi:hypothetical protein